MVRGISRRSFNPAGTGRRSEESDRIAEPFQNQALEGKHGKQKEIGVAGFQDTKPRVFHFGREIPAVVTSKRKAATVVVCKHPGIGRQAHVDLPAWLEHTMELVQGHLVTFCQEAGKVHRTTSQDRSSPIRKECRWWMLAEHWLRPAT